VAGDATNLESIHGAKTGSNPVNPVHEWLLAGVGGGAKTTGLGDAGERRSVASLASPGCSGVLDGVTLSEVTFREHDLDLAHTNLRVVPNWYWPPGGSSFNLHGDDMDGRFTGRRL